MKFVLNKKDIIAMNQEFDHGVMYNEASLDFALSYAGKTDNWTKALALLVRAILIDHVFEEANKRTTALLIETYAEYEGYRVNTKKLLLLVKNVLLKNITSVNRIEEMIKDAIEDTGNRA
ncbi:hypothetical protein KY362_01210 [Candidatus Woesearchaeota archaeon]|nr:hypothetical protein [Candidatus Woesearchaeota archaeon]